MTAQNAYEAIKSEVDDGVGNLSTDSIGLKDLGRSLTAAVQSGIEYIKEGAAVVEPLAIAAVHEVMHDAVLLGL